MPILPDRTLDGLKKFSDLAIKMYGISCDLYIPSNLTAMEGEDMYGEPSQLTYVTYYEQPIWIEWSAKDIVRLRKLGLFTETEAPITAYLSNAPTVTIQSYIQVPIKYIPGTYDTDEFEVVDALAVGTYNSEVIRRFKLAPRRVKE